MFADRAQIYIKSGKGGDGHVSFRRELYVPNGGPDGGDGGRGGDIIFEVDKGLNTLYEFRHNHNYKAEPGQEGGKQNKTGKNGEDLIIKVPEGTVIREVETGKVVADMSGDNQRVTVLNGGRGGKGNQHYATPTMQAPKYAQPGQQAMELNVILELKVIADVGLVGFPNVGKSTLLSRVTNAQPKIANYHFTTLNPNLGVVDLPGGKGFVIADIPVLIEGASEGVGLGHEFLRHIERTKVIIHMVDAASVEGRDPIADIKAITKEVFGNTNVLVQQVELYKDMVQITVKEATEEQISSLNDKINEKYEIENQLTDIKIVHISNVRLRSIIKPYILPISIVSIITIVFAMIVFRKLGALKVAYEVAISIVAPQVILASLYAVTRIPINRLTSIIAIIIFIISLVLPMVKLNKVKEEKLKEAKSKE